MNVDGLRVYGGRLYGEYRGLIQIYRVLDLAFRVVLRILSYGIWGFGSGV